MQELQLIQDFTTDLIQLAVKIIPFVVAWFRHEFFRKMSLIYHYGAFQINKKPLVLIWSDDDIQVSEKLCTKLSQYLPEYSFKALTSPRDIFEYPQNPKVVRCVIFIVSDVTKLSENEKTREKIQKWIETYIKRGGGFIGTHDIIYRRVRNTILERLFGGQINDFKRVEVVKYKRNPKLSSSHVIFKDLPNEFTLKDGEIIWGTWDEDITVAFFASFENGEVKPAVVLKDYPNAGRVVWINSADKREEHIEESVYLPQKKFVILLRNSILWASRSGIDPKQDQ